MLERMQRRATKIIPDLTSLKECGLITLETMRLRGDQIEVFKILNGYEDMIEICFSHTRNIRQLEDMM